MATLGLRKVSASAAAVLAGALLLSAGGSWAVSPRSTPAPSAPYFEIGGPHPGSLDAAIEAGSPGITFAFVDGRGCTPVWDAGGTVAHDRSAARQVEKAQSAGLDVTVSFGGAGTTELAVTCHQVSDLEAAYQSVVDDLDVTSLDFDIEGRVLGHGSSASIDRRFEALTDLEAANPDLAVSLTIPVAPSGLTRADMRLLRAAKEASTRIDLVNVMAMDYGEPVKDMGAVAIAAARATRSQLRTIWPGAAYSMVGVTPMIGDNDSAHETFTLKDARRLVAAGSRMGLGRLAFWSVNRDRACSRSYAARNGCSGVKQQPLAFTKAFAG